MTFAPARPRRTGAVRWAPRPARLAPLAGGLLALAACGGGTDPGPTEPPAIRLVMDSTVSVVQGQQNTVTLSVVRTGGFTGAVSLDVTTLPTGVSGKLETSLLTAGASATVLPLSASLNAPLGSFPFAVSASATGVATVTASGTITVRQAPNFSIALTPAEMAIEQGTSANGLLVLTRQGDFGGTVSFSATGLPAGMSVAFTPAATTGDTVRSVVTVAPGVAVGVYAGTIRGEGSPGVRAVTLQVTVTAAAPPASYELHLLPDSAVIQAGASGSLAVSISRTGGFSGPVALSLTGLPTGVSGTFTPAAPTGNAATLALTVVSAVAPGSYVGSVRGTAQGLADRAAPLRLIVQPAPGGFSLSASTLPLTVQSGRSGARTISVVKTGSFTAPVTLSALNLPTGVTASFSPPSPAAGAAMPATEATVTSTMTVSVPESFAPGAYEFQVRGRATGQPDQTIGMVLDVVPPPGTGNTTFTFCGSFQLPIWLAAQDGSGAWQRVMPVASGTTASYSFDIGTAGAVAAVTGSASIGYGLAVYYGTRTELQAVGASLCPTRTTNTRTLTGSIRGVTGDDQVTISLGDAGESATAAEPTFTLKGAPATAADLLAVRTRTELVGDGAVVHPVGLIVRRGTTYTSTIPPLEFASEAVAPQAATVTLENLRSENVTASLDIVTATTAASLGFGVELETTTLSLGGMPTALLQTGDLHQLSVYLGAADRSGARTWTGWSRQLADRSVTLPDPLSAPTVSVVPGSGAPRFRVSGSVQAQYASGLRASFAQDQADGSSRAIELWAGASQLAGPSYSLTVPALVGVSGYSSGWGMAMGVPVRWEVVARGQSSAGVAPVPADGAWARTGERAGELTP